MDDTRGRSAHGLPSPPKSARIYGSSMNREMKFGGSRIMSPEGGGQRRTESHVGGKLGPSEGLRK